MLYLSSALVRACVAAARAAHPNETIALLQGHLELNGDIVLERLVIPPGLDVDEDSSQFNPWALPSSVPYLGVFHSHPQGRARLSQADVHAAAHEGGVQLILAFPYRQQGLRAYDPCGKSVPYAVRG